MTMPVEPQVVAAVALTIAGSDPSGGAGLQADLKTFQQYGVYGMSVVTLLTVQNTQSVEAIHLLPIEFVQRQLTAVVGDIPPLAVKTGALGSADLIAAIAPNLPHVPLIVDPVLVSKHGHALAETNVAIAYRERLFPRAWMITPNRFELEAVTGCQANNPQSLETVIDHLHDVGVPHVLVKLGVRDGRASHVLSLLGRRVWISQPHVEAASNHGAGCLLSAAITAQVTMAAARAGSLDVELIVRQAIDATYRAVAYRNGLGGGISPAETRVL